MAASILYADAYYGPMLDRKDHEVKTRIADYKAGAAYDANSYVKMARVPSGARILAIEWNSSALGVGRTLDIGDGSTMDKYLDGADVSAAAGGTLLAGVDFPDAVLSADGVVTFKVLGDTLPSAGVLRAVVKYKMTGVVADEDAVAS